jgi:hypothetical protein
VLEDGPGREIGKGAVHDQAFRPVFVPMSMTGQGPNFPRGMRAKRLTAT